MEVECRRGWAGTLDNFSVEEDEKAAKELSFV